MNKYLGAYRVQNVHAIEITNFGLTEVRGYGGCFFEGGHLISDLWPGPYQLENYFNLLNILYPVLTVFTELECSNATKS